MQLAAHSDAGHLNEAKVKICASVHIYLSDNVPILTFNGAVPTIAQITKCVMSSVAEAELASLFITAHKFMALSQTLIEMLWPQQPITCR